MLSIKIDPPDMWDEEKEEFVCMKGQTLQLEHSLVSLSKWESKWCKPFLTKEKKTFEETMDYVKFMTLTQNVNPFLYNFLSEENIDEINRYIEAPMTATTFSKDQSKGPSSREQVTAELIYYWMITLNIPFECQKWHLNRLLTLIRVCNVKNTPPKKSSMRDIMRRHNALNAARRKQLHSRG